MKWFIPVQEDGTVTPVTAVGAVAALLALLVSVMALQRSSDDVALDSSAAAGAETTLVADAEDATVAAVGVDLAEFTIAPDPITVAPGGTLDVTNSGAIPHNLQLKGQETTYGTTDLNAGDGAVIDLAGLEPGEYPMYCSIAGHESSGMAATLVIDADAEAPAAADAPEGEAVTTEDGSDLTGTEHAEWLRTNYEESVSQFPATTEVMGNQPLEPEILEDGTKVFELTLDEVEWEIAPGEFVDAVGYNGQVPGPWIRTEVGDTVTLRVINDLDDEATTLHPHGVFQHEFEADGVGMISMEPIMPGEMWEDTFVTDEISVGMYHGHDNGVHQVINGAFGAFTVGQLPLPPQVDDIVSEEVMVLNDAGEIGLTLNGKSFPATEPYVLEQGEQMLLHFYNEGLTAHPMHLHNQPMMIIAKDGYPLPDPVVMDTVNVAPGERYSAVIFGETPGTWVFHCHILTHVERDDGSVFGMFTALIVNPGEDVEGIAADISTRVGRGLLGGASSPDALAAFGGAGDQDAAAPEEVPAEVPGDGADEDEASEQ
ncbi:MAG TPA: multicopper oxidase domain-containing protein [Euzebya sp.]|nr:multicopper oxidase domain-containing protein [Euzebya sp.]